MNVPILKHGDVLTATLLEAASDRELAGLGNVLVTRTGRERIRGVILDVSGVDVLDSFAVRTIADIAAMVRLRGAELVVVGIQPDVAFSMVQLGLGLAGIPAALDYEEGVARLAARPQRGRP